jgi:hypothetical protein
MGVCEILKNRLRKICSMSEMRVFSDERMSTKKVERHGERREEKNQ